MDSVQIMNYILAEDRVSVPKLMERLSVSYSQAKSALDELTEKGYAELASGVEYRVKKPASASTPLCTDRRRPCYTPKDDKERLYIKVLWECIKSGRVDEDEIQQKCSIGFSTAIFAIKWMEASGYITPSPYRRVIMSKETFLTVFGEPESVRCDDALRALLANTKCSDDDLDESDDLDDLDQFIDDDDEFIDDDDDDDDDGFESDEVVEKLLKEGDKAVFAFDDAIVASMRRGLKETDYGSCILDIDEKQGFRFKLVRGGRDLKISDGGNTLAGRADLTRRRVANVLKGYSSVYLDGNEISIVVKDPIATLLSFLKLYAAVDAVSRLK